VAVGPATTVLKSSTRTPVSGGGKKLKIAQRYPVIYCESIMTTPTGRPEDRARSNIDRLLTDSGWIIQNRDGINIDAGRGIAIREFLLWLWFCRLPALRGWIRSRRGRSEESRCSTDRKRSEADRTALKEAAAQLDTLLAAKDVTENELVADFKRWRAAKRK
jgi:hypothetical protein